MLQQAGRCLDGESGGALIGQQVRPRLYTDGRPHLHAPGRCARLDIPPLRARAEDLDVLDLQRLVERHGPLPPERVVFRPGSPCPQSGCAHSVAPGPDSPCPQSGCAHSVAPGPDPRAHSVVVRTV